MDKAKRNKIKETMIRAYSMMIRRNYNVMVFKNTKLYQE